MADWDACDYETSQIKVYNIHQTIQQYKKAKELYAIFTKLMTVKLLKEFI